MGLFDVLTGGRAPRQRTKAVVILDRSGSMTVFRDAAVEGLNLQLESIRAKSTPDHEILTSIVTFHDPGSLQDLRWEVAPSALTPIAVGDYIPDGASTALFDAVGQTVTRLRSLPDARDPNLAYLITVVTDGEENASREYTRESLARLLQECQAEGRWTFTFIGTNLDLGQLQKDFTVFRGNTQRYAPSAAGISGAFLAQCEASSRFYGARAAGVMCSSNFYASAGDAEPDLSGVKIPPVTVATGMVMTEGGGEPGEPTPVVSAP